VNRRGPGREVNGIPASGATTPVTDQKRPSADESVQAMATDADQLPDDVLLAMLGTCDSRFMAVFVQAFEQALAHARMYGPPHGPVRTWLRTIARDIAVDAIKARDAQPVNRDDLDGLLTTMSDGPAGLRALLGRLPASQARAVTMVSLYGMTARQIADAEGIPLSEARMRISDGMGKLRVHTLRLASQ
jgi:DNA-directed RNA polymerase specialized sigma24 family protein